MRLDNLNVYTSKDIDITESGGVSDRHFHHKLQLGVAHAQSKLEFGTVQDGVSSWLDVFLEFF